MNPKFLKDNIGCKVTVTLDVLVQRQDKFNKDEKFTTQKMMVGDLIDYDDISVTISGDIGTKTCINLDKTVYIQEYNHNK